MSNQQHYPGQVVTPAHFARLPATAFDHEGGALRDEVEEQAVERAEGDNEEEEVTL